ncbi:serine palmitoyltransferase small subunit A isoform X1 [Poecile atricapillus]|uniref:serine palmitoyltransferase small subunit A isoform X1 n=1 Tax=Poecile atricapillus TaxID=48891 RepID=UPI00273A32AF|nr:serine palmitoyltransferase small subunit A isoform X1 [Poecile atricapillus]
MALGSAWKQMSWLYYQYLLVTALYMLEPWERTVFSILLPAGPGGPGSVGRFCQVPYGCSADTVALGANGVWLCSSTRSEH